MANDKYLFVVSGAAGTGKDSVKRIRRSKRLFPPPPAHRVPVSRRAWIIITAPGSSSSS